MPPGVEWRQDNGGVKDMNEAKRERRNVPLIANVGAIRAVLNAALVDPGIEWDTPLGDRVKREIKIALESSGGTEGFQLLAALGRLDTLAPGFCDGWADSSLNGGEK
jgi:hypothetical protein